ncbi:DUF86 domain-containing protein [Candidatus Thorarchaeota archaeon]|nr:MAG: DUF86 domain-containing protein [Candidatus Thorarchaeota archaeon]
MIVHVYIDIDPKIIYESTERAIQVLNAFVEAIKELL